jgi:voltage-gated potassium channel
MLREFAVAHVSLLGETAGLLGAVAVVIVAAGFLLAHFDRRPLEEAIYLAFITAFTVGFGDVTPRSRGARAVTIVLAFVGLILVGILVGIAVHAFDIALERRGL